MMGNGLGSMPVRKVSCMKKLRLENFMDKKFILMHDFCPKISMNEVVNSPNR